MKTKTVRGVSADPNGAVRAFFGETGDPTESGEEFSLDSVALARPLDGTAALVWFKAAMYAKLLQTRNVKSGIIGSHSRITQGVESAVSYGVPGDMSRVRKPVRSTVYRAVTPGGGEDNDRLGRTIGRVRRAAQIARCPAGFENGGQFTGRGMQGCGARLFEIPGSLDDQGKPFGRLGLVYGFGRTIRGGANLNDPLLIRAAKVGPLRSGEREKAITNAITSIGANLQAPNAMIRRDAVVMRPVAAIEKLASYRNNRDMDGGAMVLRAATPDAVSPSDLKLLGRTKLSTVAYALPGGSSLRVDATRALTAGDRRRVNQAVALAKPDGDDPSAPLRMIVDRSNGALSYREDYPNIKNPTDLVEITKDGKTVRKVRRWVYDTYLKDDKNRWQLRSVVSSDTSVSSGDNVSLAKAVAALDDRKDPAGIAPGLLGDALRASRAYKRRRRAGQIDHVRDDGRRFIEAPSRRDNEHLGRRFAADVQRNVGMQAPDVAFIGTGSRRSTLTTAPEHVFDDGVLDVAARAEQVDAESAVRLAVADYLSDVPVRAPSSLVTVRSGPKAALVATGNESAGLAGLDANAAAARIGIPVSEFYGRERLRWFRRRFELLTPAQREVLLGVYDDAIGRAAKFDVDAYAKKLALDGELSDAERVHLEAVRRLYKARLKNLRSRRGEFLSTLGLNR